MSSGMSALLAYGYVLSSSDTGQWDVTAPGWDDNEYEMKWPHWVDPDDVAASMENRLRAEFGYAGVTVTTYGNLKWDEQPVLCYITESAHEADDGPLTLNHPPLRKPAWDDKLREALLLLGITPEDDNPAWILAPSTY